MDKNKEFIVEEKDREKRIDVLICEKFQNISRNFVHKLFSEKAILLNEKTTKKHQKEFW